MSVSVCVCVCFVCVCVCTAECGAGKVERGPILNGFKVRGRLYTIRINTFELLPLVLRLCSVAKFCPEAADVILKVLDLCLLLVVQLLLALHALDSFLQEFAVAAAKLIGHLIPDFDHLCQLRRVEQRLLVRDDDYRALVGRQVLAQPGLGLGIEMVRGLV